MRTFVINRIEFVLLLLISLSWQSVLAQSSAVDSTFHIYLLVGQSNMSGRGALDSVAQKINPKILSLDKENNWQIAKDPLHFDRGYATVGPGISFAEHMLPENENIKIGLVPCAWGGSPIRVWQPGATYFENHPYDEAIARAKVAMQKGVLKGILWHQGESDNDSIQSALYLNKLVKLVENFRKDLNLPGLPFIAGEIGNFNKDDFINSKIDSLTQLVKNTAVVSAAGLSDKGDQLHFDTPSARELGKRYAVAVKRLKAKIKGQKPPVVVLTFDDAEISHYTNVAPMLKKYGFNATFFVCEFPLHSPEEKDQYMSWQQIRELYDMGFEIGNHTGHHRNVTKLSAKDVKKEIKYIEKMCRKYGIPKPVSFAYPGNRHDSISRIRIAKLGYDFGRAGGSRTYDVKNDWQMAMPSYTMGTSKKLRTRTLNAINSLKPDEILIFTIHGVPDLIHPDYSTSVEELREYLDYFKMNGIKVIAVRDLKQYVQ